MKGLFKTVLLNVVASATLFTMSLADADAPQGNIHVGTEIMLASAPGDVITAVKLVDSTNGKVYSYPGCGSSECEFNIASLPVGCYDGTIVTETESIPDFDCKR